MNQPAYDLKRMIELAAVASWDGEPVEWKDYLAGFTAAWRERTPLIQVHAELLETARATQTTMQDEITAKDARIAELEAILATVARNAPTAEPTRLQRDTLPQAWSFWQAGRLAKRVLGITD